MTEDQLKYYEHLTKIMHQTRGVRFTAAETEKRKEIHSIITIAFLSIYLTVWAFITAVYPERFGVDEGRVLSGVSVIASISLLVISLFDYAAGRSVTAEKFLQNALHISPLLRELERLVVSPQPDEIRMSEIASEYELLIASAGVNHTSSDFRVWAVEKMKSATWYGTAAIWIFRPALRCLPFIYSAIFQISLVLLVILATGWVALKVFFH